MAFAKTLLVAVICLFSLSNFVLETDARDVQLTRSTRGLTQEQFQNVENSEGTEGNEGNEGTIEGREGRTEAEDGNDDSLPAGEAVGDSDDEPAVAAAVDATDGETTEEPVEEQPAETTPEEPAEVGEDEAVDEATDGTDEADGEDGTDEELPEEVPEETEEAPENPPEVMDAPEEEMEIPEALPVDGTEEEEEEEEEEEDEEEEEEEEDEEDDAAAPGPVEAGTRDFDFADAPAPVQCVTLRDGLKNASPVLDAALDLIAPADDGSALSAALDDPSLNVTVLLPDDTILGAVGEQLGDDASGITPEVVQEILLDHILAMPLEAAEIIELDSGDIELITGEDIELDVDGDSVMFTLNNVTATVIETDVDGCAGESVIHRIDNIFTSLPEGLLDDSIDGEDGAIDRDADEDSAPFSAVFVPALVSAFAGVFALL